MGEWKGCGSGNDGVSALKILIKIHYAAEHTKILGLGWR